MTKFFRNLWRYYNPWYVLEVTHRGRDLQIIVKDFKKKTPNLISGWDYTGEWFEIRSETPMDYFIEEYTDDLK